MSEDLTTTRCLESGYLAGLRDGRLIGSRSRLFDFIRLARETNLPLEQVNKYLENYIFAIEDKNQLGGNFMEKTSYGSGSKNALRELPSRCLDCAARDSCWDGSGTQVHSFKLNGADSDYLANAPFIHFSI